MKSFLIWCISTAIGGGLGYLFTFIIDISFLISLFGGIILGSTAGITVNIHRNRDEFEADEEQEEA